MTTKAEGTGEIHSLNIVRGFAMLLIISAHAGYPLSSILDHIEVPAFFLVTGMLFKPEPTLKQFLVKKVWRIIVPFILFSVLFFIPWVFLNLYWLKVADLWVVGYSIAKVLLCSPNTPLWFLKALFIALVAYRYIDFVARKSALINLVVALTLSALAAWTSTLQWDKAWLLAGFPQALTALPLICWGALIMRYRNLLVTTRQNMLPLAILAVCAAIVAVTAGAPVWLHKGSIGPGGALRFFPCALCSFIGIVIIAEMIGRLKPVELIGRNSLSIMGIHKTILYLLGVAFVIPLPVTLGITIIASIAGALLLKRYLPSLSGHKFMKGHKIAQNERF